MSAPVTPMPWPWYRDYLVPLGDEGAEQGTEMLHTLLHRLVEAYQLADACSCTLLEDEPRYTQPLAAAYAAQFRKDWGLGVANPVLVCLQQVCDFIQSICHDPLLALATQLDNRSATQAKDAVVAFAEASDLLQDFHASLLSLRRACCSTSLDTHNLFLGIQTLVPSLARLSSKIDTDALAQQARLAEVAQTNAPTHLAQLANIAQFNTHVSLVLALVQRILNVMSDWQDRLDALMAMSPDAAPARFYEYQVEAALLY
jgi:hypothetical protein